MKRYVLVCLGLFACGGGSANNTPPTTTTSTLPPPAAPKTYAIHLHRPSKVGDKVHIVVDQTEEKATQITAAGKTIDEKPEKHVYHLDAVESVVAVDDQGRTTKEHEDVKDLVIDGKSLGPATVDITRAPKEKDATVLVDDKPAPKRIREVLESVMKLNLERVDDDQVFGTTTRQAVGAHWPVNVQLAHDSLLEDTQLDAKTVTGDVWLDGITRAADTDCADVHAKMTLDGVSLPLPAGQKMESSRADVELRAALPVDGSLPRANEHMGMTMAMKIDVTTPKGVAVVAVTVKRVRDAVFAKAL